MMACCCDVMLVKLEHIHRHISPQQQQAGTVCLEQSVWNCVPGTVCLELSAWNCVPGTVCLELCAWNRVPGTVCLEPCAWNCLPGTVCLEQSAWNCLPGTVCLELCAWNSVPGTVCRELCAWNCQYSNHHFTVNSSSKDPSLHTWLIMHVLLAPRTHYLLMNYGAVI